jgi:hypothetical protein
VQSTNTAVAGERNAIAGTRNTVAGTRNAVAGTRNAAAGKRDAVAGNGRGTKNSQGPSTVEEESGGIGRQVRTTQRNLYPFNPG